METDIKRDCSRGCTVKRSPQGELICAMQQGCCKLSTHNWLEGIPTENAEQIYEVRFKNTRKAFFKNTMGTPLHTGDIVAVEALSGHDIGIISMEGPMVFRQIKRKEIHPDNYVFRKIYRKARVLDLEKWQEAVAREHQTMIRSRQIAASLSLNMKIGDVEFQGDGTKAIFYYIADERVDFRQLIRVFADEFKIKIEMRQIGARQEAGLIGGLGVCGQALCCSRWMVDFVSITTQAARCQDLTLNPQKLGGQCGKLKCCINYEASTYIDAHKALPQVHHPLQTADGPAYLVKTDVLSARMWFSYDPHSLAKTYELPAERVREYIRMNKEGKDIPSLSDNPGHKDQAPEFKSAVGEGSLTRFDKQGQNRNDGSGRRPDNRRRRHNRGGNKASKA
jgi:Uncharacterized homolog of PSP1